MTMVKELIMRGGLRAMQFTGSNAKDIEEFTGGRFEAAGDRHLYLDEGKPGIVREIDAGAWIMHLPWLRQAYQDVDGSLFDHFFDIGASV